MTAAFAHEQTTVDPDNSLGPLDVVVAQHRHRTVDFHRNGTGGLRTSLTFTLVTYETWSYEAVSGNRNFAAFEVDVDRDGEIDRCVVITSSTSSEGEDVALRYQANVHGGCRYFDDRLIRSFGTENVRRPDEHSIRVVIPNEPSSGAT